MKPTSFRPIESQYSQTRTTDGEFHGQILIVTVFAGKSNQYGKQLDWDFACGSGLLLLPILIYFFTFALFFANDFLCQFCVYLAFLFLLLLLQYKANNISKTFTNTVPDFFFNTFTGMNRRSKRKRIANKKCPARGIRAEEQCPARGRYGSSLLWH